MLELQAVSLSVGGSDVLRGVDLAVGRGDLVLVKGPSGSGKTTMLRVAGLVDAPTEGRVVFDGVDTGALSDRARADLRRDELGHVFQAHNMVPDLTLFDNVVLPMRLAGSVDLDRARQLLAAVGLEHRMYRLPGNVSVGERQRAAFARALANDPAFILADEPTASLDAERASAVVEILLRLWKEGRAVVVASHDPRVWTSLADARTYVMESGVLRKETGA